MSTKLIDKNLTEFFEDFSSCLDKDKKLFGLFFVRDEKNRVSRCILRGSSTLEGTVYAISCIENELALFKQKCLIPRQEVRKTLGDNNEDG